MTESPLATMLDVVDGFARVLAGEPSPLMAPSQVGARRPALIGDMPFVSVGLHLGGPHVRGLGWLIEGERPGRRPGDPPLGERRTLRMSGIATLEVWALSDRDVSDDARRIDQRLCDRRATRPHGFLSLEPAALRPAEMATRPASSGSGFPAWSLALEYRFHFERSPEPAEGGGIIERIDVDLSHLPDPGPEDHLVIPADHVPEGG